MQWEQDRHENPVQHDTNGPDRIDPAEALDVLANVKNELDDVQEALRRLDSGSYGTCETCGERINDEQLQHAPSGRWCADHQP